MPKVTVSLRITCFFHFLQSHCSTLLSLRKGSKLDMGTFRPGAIPECMPNHSFPH